MLEAYRTVAARQAVIDSYWFHGFASAGDITVCLDDGNIVRWTRCLEILASTSMACLRITRSLQLIKALT